MFLKLLLIPFLLLVSLAVQDPVQPQPEHKPGLNAVIRADEWNYERVLFDLQLRRGEARTLTRIRTAILEQLDAHDIDPASVPGFEAWNLEIVRTCAAVQAQFSNTRQFDQEGNALDRMALACDPVAELLIDRPEDAGVLRSTSPRECKALLFAWAPELAELTGHAIVETGDLVTKLAIDAMR